MQIKSYINKALNINSDEWPRITISWLIHFFLKIGFVIGWTILVAMFLSRIGIEKLPFLFIVNALLIIVGASLFSKIVNIIKKEHLILGISVAAGAILCFSTLFASTPSWIFFGLILIAEAVFLSQLSILGWLFVEDLFSPLESERTFPIIESAETIGGIVGGFIIITLARHIAPYKFIFIWAIATLMIVITIFFFKTYAKKVPFLHFQKHKTEKQESIKKIFSAKGNPFLKGLLLIILLQWLFVNILEFQYTKAIAQSITTQAGYEASLTYSLGSLHIIFSACALFIQLLAASRVIKYLGITGSMALHPLVCLLSLFGFTLRFNFLSAVITKTGHEMSHVIFKNSYHSSYYALKHKIRKQTKEFLEGFVKPVGAIIGMIFIIGLQRLTHNENLTLSINILMIAITAILFIRTLNLRGKYTKLSCERLSNSASKGTKLNAIEILSQKGHKNSGEKLTNMLSSEEEKEIQVKIIKALGEIKDPATLPEIIEYIDNPDKKIRNSAIETLGKFKKLGKHFYAQAFSKHRAINKLKELFRKEQTEEIRESIIKVLANLDQNDIIDFLLKTLKESKNPKIKADCIYLCGLFHDPNAAYYIKPYLKSRSPRIKANTIIALWQFKKYGLKLKKELSKMLEKKDRQILISALYTIGEIKAEQEIKKLLKCLKSEDFGIKKQATIALLKMENSEIISEVSSLLLKANNKTVEEIKKVGSAVSPKFWKEIKKALEKKASTEINRILSQNTEKKDFIELDTATLEKIKNIYKRVEEHHEVDKIERVLQQKENQIKSEKMVLTYE